MATEKPTVVVVGAGFAGQSFIKQVKDTKDFGANIIVLEPSETLMLGTTLDSLLQGEAKMEDIAIPVKDTWAADFVAKESVTKLNVEDRIITTDKREIKYDYLVLGCGARPDVPRFPGLLENANNMCSPADNVKLREELLALKEGSVAVCVPTPLIKCPPSPIMWSLCVDSVLREAGVRDNVSVTLYTIEPFPLEISGQANGDFLKGLLKAKDVGCEGSKALQKVTTEGGKKTLHFNDGTTASCDVLVTASPLAPPAFIDGSGLKSEKTGFVNVDAVTCESTLEKGRNIFAIGDVSEICLPNSKNWEWKNGRLKPHPKVGMYAIHQGKRVAQIISNRVAESAGQAKPYPDVEKTTESLARCFVRTSKDQAVIINALIFYQDDAPMPDIKLTEPSPEQHKEAYAVIGEWVKDWTKPEGAVAIKNFFQSRLDKKQS